MCTLRRRGATKEHPLSRMKLEGATLLRASLPKQKIQATTKLPHVLAMAKLQILAGCVACVAVGHIWRRGARAHGACATAGAQ
jgi:hypothetical protein